MIFYAVNVFQDLIGDSQSGDPYVASIFTGLIRLVGALIGAVLVKKVPRKTLMVASALIMAVAMFALGFNILYIEQIKTSSDISR